MRVLGLIFVIVEIIFFLSAVQIGFIFCHSFTVSHVNIFVDIIESIRINQIITAIAAAVGTEALEIDANIADASDIGTKLVDDGIRACIIYIYIKVK